MDFDILAGHTEARSGGFANMRRDQSSPGGAQSLHHAAPGNRQIIGEFRHGLTVIMTRLEAIVSGIRRAPPLTPRTLPDRVRHNAMRYSKLFGKTVRDKPRNADSESHQLLLRAGFVRPAAGGGFLLLPLGQRVMARIEALVAGELRTAGAAMLGLPAGKQAANSDLSRSLRLRRREAASDYPFADHHESTLAMLGGSLALSYRDLPLLVAGARWASREGAHPNWGLLAAPEFPFHSAYVFGGPVNSIGAPYRRAMERIGVQAFAMASAADAASTELAIETALAARPILACDRCGYRAPAEIAVSHVPDWPQDSAPGVTEAVYGPGLIQVEPLAQFLGIPVHQTTKTMLFEAHGRTVAACVAGIYGVSEAKMMRVLGCRSLALAAPEVVRELTHSEVGYAGPAGLPDSVEVIWDLSTEHRSNFEAGANQTDHHRINLNFGRDVARPEKFFDIRASLPASVARSARAACWRRAAPSCWDTLRTWAVSTPSCSARSTWKPIRPRARSPRRARAWIWRAPWPRWWSSTTMAAASSGRPRSPRSRRTWFRFRRRNSRRKGCIKSWCRRESKCCGTTVPNPPA